MADPARVTELTIDGMHCGGCVARVKKALEKLPGVIVDDVKVGSARVRLGAVAEGEVKDALARAGYPVTATGAAGG